MEKYRVRDIAKMEGSASKIVGETCCCESVIRSVQNGFNVGPRSVNVAKASNRGGSFKRSVLQPIIHGTQARGDNVVRSWFFPC